MASPANDEGTSLQRLRAALLAPVPIHFLVFFRIGFGAVMLWEVFRYFDKGWIARYYIRPQFFFKYYGFEWVRPWAGDGMYLHFAVLGVLAFCILAGYRYRIAAALFFLGFTHVFLLDATRYLNHFYLISLLSFLMIFLPAERKLSLDVRRNPALEAETVPAWTLWILRAQLGIAYIYGGIAKLNGDWLRGEPMRAWLSRRTDVPVIGRYFQDEWMVWGFVYGGLLLDLFVVPLLLWSKTRRYAFAAAVAFHLLNARLFSIGIFPWFMLIATLIFFPPELFAGDRAAVRSSRRRPAAASPATNRYVLPFLAIYMLLQLLIPLRHHLYPGNVAWTEEGHRFSWRMKLRDKKARARFTITHPPTGRRWRINPRTYLDSRQTDRMAAHPDMVLQFAHYLARRKQREGYAGVEVRARVMASVNGRDSQLLVDPALDLARVHRSLLPAPWIQPLTQPLPERAARVEGEGEVEE